jgi:hypothetical protein
VRIAGPADVEALYWLLLGDLQADNSLGVPVSAREVARIVRKLCSGDGGIVGVIDGLHGKPVGSVAIEAAKPWFSDTWILSQVWLFVTVDERHGQHFADDLFSFAEWHRADMSAKVGYDMVLENTVMSRTRLPAKIRLWGRHGQQIGGVFWTGAGNGQEHNEVGHTGDNGA